MSSLFRIATLFCCVFVVSCREDEPPEVVRTSEEKAVLNALFEPPVRDPSVGHEFVGANSCRECHAQAYDDWSKSHHHAAMQEATPETVLADFDDATFEHFGRTTRFFRKGDEFWVNTEDGDGERKDFQVTYTFGITPLQQYLIPFPGGRLQALNICWDTRPKGEGGQRWYHLYQDEEIPPDDVLHWTRRHFNWNYMCADCHSTNLAKNFDVETNSYDTSWSEMNVSCEACHGPASEHLKWANALKEGTTPTTGMDGNFGLLVDLRKDGGVWAIDPESGQPKRTKPLENQNQVETCAPCHAHRQPLQEKRLYGQTLLDSYIPTVLTPLHYHGDGQIDEEVYVYGSFVQSKMYHNSVKCSDCHHPHTMQTYAQDNSLCSRCHTPATYDTPAHHFHQAGSTGASCIECHMPPKYYMGVDKRRDHSIRIPRPDLSKTYGTPNACNTCHTDKDAAWAANAFHGWWGKKARPHFSEHLVKGHRDPQVWEKELARLANNQEFPAIARASALDLMVDNPTQLTLKTIESRLQDKDPIVRHHAVSGIEFAGMQPLRRIELGAPLLRDPIRAVRVEAGRALADIDRRQFQLEDLKALDSAVDEYIEAQMAVADVPEGHMSLALLYQKQNKPGKVEAAYKTAIRIDPLYIPARINLAEHYFQTGRTEEAAPILREGVERQPKDGFAHEALGRFLVRVQQYEEGMNHIATAAELLPDRADLRYFLGVGLNQTSGYKEAFPQLKKAVELDPSNVEYLTGIVLICWDAADFEQAAFYNQRLMTLQPGNRQYASWQEALLQGRPRQ
tara:strand:+ start:8937 stop:11312 length:2376 start_codon:yes stop_codon:yes gene_type:complete